MAELSTPNRDLEFTEYLIPGTKYIYRYIPYCKTIRNFLQVLMNSDRVKSSPERHKTVKRMIQLLIDGLLKPGEFLRTLELELDRRPNSFKLSFSLERGIRLLKDEMLQYAKMGKVPWVNDDGIVDMVQEWKTERFRNRVQQELFKLIQNINKVFNFGEEISTVEFAAIEWEDKIFRQENQREHIHLKYQY
jgi:hypothetical protein